MKNVGIFLILIASIIPYLLWGRENSYELNNFRDLSVNFALIGATLFSINFILSGRFKFLETIFGGLNRIYIIHHTVGQLALIFLCFHPILIGFYYLKISVSSAFEIFFPPIVSGYATWLGLSALTLLIILLVLTLYIKLPYHIWKLTHKFMGMSLFLATLHIFFIPSDVSTNMPLRFYILTVCSVGLISYSYRVLFGRFLVKRYKYIVSSVSEKQNVNLITLSPASNAINSFLPGQFIFVSFVSPGVTPETHPFSLTSKSGDREISIAAKSSGDYTETLKSLKEGSEAFVEGPFGRFSYLEARRKKQIWIAGGIGITPFVSMAKNFEIGNGYDVVLYYLVSDKSEAVFAEALNDISAANLGFRVKLINTHSHGRLTGEMVKADIEDFYERDIFICGPPPMMKSLRSQFNSLGIKNSHILSEEFSLD